MTVHRLLVSALVAAVAGAATAVSVAPPAAALLPGTAAPTRTPGRPVEWVAVPPAPGCARSTDRFACHRVTVEGTGVDCDPTGCVLEDGGTGWSEQMELQAVAGMYAADPPVAPGG